MHKHTHAPNKKIINRMSKIVGHASSITKMIEQNRDCTEILIQIAAVRSALNSVGKILLDEHIKYCVKEAILNETYNKDEILEDLKQAIDKYVK